MSYIYYRSNANCFISSMYNPSYQLASWRINNLDYAELFKELQNTFAKFREVSGDYEVNHIIINLYLVITSGRRGFILETYSEALRENKEAVLEEAWRIVNKYSLYMSGDNDNGYLIAKEPIDLAQLSNDLYLGRMLDFGCLDPNYFDIFQQRIGYHFYASINNDSYPIMSYICTLPYRVTEEVNMRIVQKFSSALVKMSSEWNVWFETENVMPYQPE